MSDDVSHPTVLGADGRPIPTGGTDAPAKAPRRRRGWDIALSILLLAMTGAAALFGAIIGVVTLATLNCPVTVCETDGAIGTLFLTGIVATIIVVAGVIASVTVIVRRHRGWWVAALALLLVVTVWVLGLNLYGAAVSA